MVLNKKVISKILCAVMAILGLAMLIPGAVAVFYGERDVAIIFAACALPTSILGVLGVKLLPKQDNSIIRMRDGFFIVAATWFLMSVIGCLPFIFSGAIPKFADAFFETASGFTTTGSTILTEIEHLPRGILFWRAFTHWLGGMGVLVLTIALLPMLGIGGQKIMRAETTGPTMDKISSTISGGARGLYYVYIAFTLIETILLGVCGMDLFDAITHSFGTIGTGGFSSYNNSIAHFNSLPIELIIAVFMVLAGVNFSLYHTAITKRSLSVFSDPEFKGYMIIVASSTAFLTIMLTISNSYKNIWESLRMSFFQVASIVSSTGFATTDFEVWPASCKFIILLLMLVGACAGSTAGGLKVIRVILLGKLVKRNVQKRLSPRTVTTIKLGGKEVTEDTLNGVAAHTTLFFALLILGTFLISLSGTDNITSFTSVLTCLSNIGPGFNLVGPTCNFAFYNGAIKILLSVFMIAGRLEMFTIVLLFTKDFWNKNK